MHRRTFLTMTAVSTLGARTLPADLFSKTEPVTTPLTPLASSKTLISPTDEQYWNTIRSNFPIALNADKGELLYMNNGTMGPSPKVVTDRVISRIQHVDSTGDYNGPYEEIKKALGKVIGASGDEIAFTHNVSEAISIVSSGLKLKSGDEVILTDQEHGGNAVAWLARAKKDGIVIKFVTLAPEDDEIIARFEKAITPRTRALAIPHVTCTTGHVLPIKQLADLAHKHGAIIMADGAHPPGMMQVDMKTLGVDAYTSCGHKWLCGPKGVGFLYITKEMLERVEPTWSGAEADKHWDYQGNLEFLPSASRYDFATQNFALIDGLSAAIDFMDAIGYQNIEARLRYLTTKLREGLSESVGGKFRFLTPPTSVTGLTTIKLNAMEYHDFANQLMGKYKVRTRVVPESNLEANRFSAHVYTSVSDIDRFLNAVRGVLSA